MKQHIFYRSGWQNLKVNDVKSSDKGSIVSGPFGSNIGKKFFVDEGIPLIRGNNLTFGTKKFIDDGFVYITKEKAYELRNCEALPGDLIFTAAGTLGQVGLIQKSSRYPKYIISNKQLRLRCNLGIALPIYLFYWFTSPKMREQIINLNTGSSVPLITLGTLRSLPVLLPPLPTQRKIAAILSAYDDLIENNTRRIAILEEMAQSIYQEWFVHFRYPGHEKNKMVESELGMIPEGWSLTAFSKAADFINGYAFKPHHWRQTGKPIVKIAELKNGITDKTPRYDGSDIPVKYHIQNGDLLFSWSADLDIYIWSNGEALLNQHLFNVLPYVGLTKTYLFFALKDHLQDFRSRSQGTTMKHIKRSALDEVLFLLPPEEITLLFEQYINPVLSQIQNLTSKNLILRRAHDILLPKLISGEIDVEALDIDIPDIAATEEQQASPITLPSEPINATQLALFSR